MEENIKEVKYKTDIRYATYVAVLMRNGSKQFVSCYKWITKDGFENENIVRELTPEEYIEFVKEKGFVVGAKISYWDNWEPFVIKDIRTGSGGYVQPSFMILRGSATPSNLYPARLYDCKLIVEEPTEFWHYDRTKH